MSDSNYKPSGELQGDTKPMPDRGTTTGMTGYATELDGTGLGVDATSSLGSITGATGSDAMDECCNHKPTTLGGE